MIKSGDLRHRCQLYSIDSSKNALGESEQTLVFLQNFNAQVLSNRIDSTNQADGQSRIGDLRLRARFSRQFQQDGVVGYDGRFYRILNAEDVRGMRQESLLSLEEVHGISIA